MDKKFIEINKQPTYHLPELYIKYTEGKGRGVFCANEITKNTLVEIAPVIIIPYSQRKLIDQTLIYEYYFEWEKGAIAIALGFASLYNHAKDANVSFENDYEYKNFVFTSIDNISAHTELCINYLEGDPKNENLWF